MGNGSYCVAYLTAFSAELAASTQIPMTLVDDFEPRRNSQIAAMTIFVSDRYQICTSRMLCHRHF